MDQDVVSIPFIHTMCPFNTFKKVRESQGDAFFFESASAIGEPALVSVIGLGRFQRLVGPIFQALHKFEVKAAENSIPYSSGGVFGCIGYDSITELEPKLAGHGNFANQSDQSNQLFFAKDLIVFDHKKKLIHFIGDTKKFTSCLQPQLDVLISTTELSDERLSANLGRKKFFNGIEILKKHIRKGDIFQAVLSERFECDTDAKPINIFSALRLISPTPYSFFFSFGSSDFFGASPEALLKVDCGRLRTHPIAGTRRRGENEVEDGVLQRQLELCQKEAAEHLMLVDLARNDLGRIARPGTVEVNFFRSVHRFSNVMHLVSEVDAELSPEHSVVDALGACFPAGTLSGAPKFRAMELLAEIEIVPRGFYGGAVIGFDPKAQRLDTCIAIRSLQIQNGKAILRAGAGIVADSQPEFEYAEIKHKLKPLRQAIASAESLK